MPQLCSLSRRRIIAAAIRLALCAVPCSRCQAVRRLRDGPLRRPRETLPPGGSGTGAAGDDPAVETLPIDERLARIRTGQDDPGLSALYFQFGRYLLMGSSRPGTMAANLQGIWNDSMAPPWDSKYTTNINLEMNYWPAEVGNLAGDHRTALRPGRADLDSGRKTAKEMYGARGFVFHHNIDAWADTAPVDYGYVGVWPMGGAWLALHFWEHYHYRSGSCFPWPRSLPGHEGGLAVSSRLPCR